MSSDAMIDDFDSLLLQLKRIGNVQSRSPYTHHHDTVPYFPPVTSALRRDLRASNHRQSSCVEYVDDEALPSPRFIEPLMLGHVCANSLDDIDSASAADLQLIDSLSRQQFSSLSCPDVSSPPTASNDIDFEGQYCDRLI